VFEKGSVMVATDSRPKKSGVIVPHKPTWRQRLAAALVSFLIRCVSATLRYEWSDRSGHFTNSSASPAIFAIWHNRLALCMKIYHGYVRERSGGAGLAALISASRDGGFLAAILENFRVQPVRGSSSRRGPQALRELTTWARRGYDLAITPDGPRGPRYVVQEGVMALAQITGRPIIPVSFRLGWKVRTKSWDRFQIPLPFSRCEMFFEKPICVPREASVEEREKLRLRLEETLKSISDD
jgi:lysophospholipid acyltransferase (LPLAT)-like uncharacterized protein